MSAPLHAKSLTSAEKRRKSSMYSQWSSCSNTTVRACGMSRPTSLTPSSGKICDFPPANTRQGTSMRRNNGRQSSEVWSAMSVARPFGSAFIVSAMSSRAYAGSMGLLKHPSTLPLVNAMKSYFRSCCRRVNETAS